MTDQTTTGESFLTSSDPRVREHHRRLAKQGQLPEIPPDVAHMAWIESVAETIVTFALRLAGLPASKRPVDPLQKAINSVKAVNDGNANNGDRFIITWDYHDGANTYQVLSKHVSLGEEDWEKMVHLASLNYQQATQEGTSIQNVPESMAYLRFLDAVLAVIDTLYQLPTTTISGGGMPILRVTLQRAKRTLEERPTSVPDAAFIQLARQTITTLENFASFLPDLKQHPTYETFLQEVEKIKQLPDAPLP